MDRAADLLDRLAAQAARMERRKRFRDSQQAAGDLTPSLDYARDKESPDRNHGESTIYGQSNKR
jgi:hypothetical protein